MKLDKSNYKIFVDDAYKYFLSNKKGDAELDKVLDAIDDYDNHPNIDYYRIDDNDFELYRIRRKLIRGEESGVSDSSIEDILKEAKKSFKNLKNKSS